MESESPRILVPLIFNEDHFPLLKQSAELAAKHKAEITLLYTITLKSFSIGKFNMVFCSPADIHRKINQAENIMLTWKNWTESQYGIKVQSIICYGDYRKRVLETAHKIKATIIVLWSRKQSAGILQWIINNSPCQVLTFFKPFDSISKWQNIVIPITNFVPKARINTIYKIANEYKMKLHLIGEKSKLIGKKQNSLQYLTEALSILNHSGNILTQCKYINQNQSLSKASLEYANSINADVLMTNRQPVSNY